MRLVCSPPLVGVVESLCCKATPIPTTTELSSDDEEPVEQLSVYRILNLGRLYQPEK